MQIKKIFSEILLKDNIVITNSLITVSKVKLSSDLKIANIYISFFNQKSEKTENLFKQIISQKKSIRYSIGKRLKAKYIPDIRFYIDDEYEQFDKINKLIKNG